LVIMSPTSEENFILTNGDLMIMLISKFRNLKIK